MQETELIKFIKKVTNNKDFSSIFATSFLSLVVILFLTSILVWNFRAQVFSYFAKEYMLAVQNETNENISENVKATEKILQRETIFSQESFVVDAVKKTNPAVISILISKEVPKYETYIDPNQQNSLNELFPGFYFNVPQYRQNGTEKKNLGGGSGFFVSSDGLIVTNKHVVSQTDVEYTVFTNDGKKHTATVVARDPVLDLALIKVRPVNGAAFPYLSLGNSDALKVGQSVIAIGNALAEFRNTVSVGVVSGLARSITAGTGSGTTEILDHVIQTDAAINPGNSGGPLLDLSGKVVGVNVAIVQGSQNIGFALPVNSIKGAIDSVKSTGKIVRPYVGLRYVTINKAIKEKNNLTVDYGILIKVGANGELAVVPGSPADKAGIVENDIILEVNGAKLNEEVSFASLIRGKNIGEVVSLKILHRGVEKTVKVTLEASKDI